MTALVAGFAHALEPDHMAAVTTFVSRRPRPLQAIGFGIRWGAGHSAAILVVGCILVALNIQLPDVLARGLEFGVGAMLLALGLWLLWNVLHERAHRAAGDTHGHTHHHHHGGGSLWVGMAHGLSGTAPLVAALSATLAGSLGSAALYLLLFGVGTTVAMALYALVAGVVFHQAGHRAPALAGGLRALTALGSAAIGVLWMVNAAGGGA
ncbi:sulfite exporter TauE/SafE family protein [Longimicrobium sp.]|uniref:urease accessory protein UreH domain-containing protein n=1 Tax=Longimicrobium sp. TaxID=2029185 RepID=UPI002E36AA21|nr:sulfite exporter TauE/SafE family protein [Longimicrobium sp.]HEX6039755.1 sulfite exporter TauE/SafE family protein [Longimicrobium sp.]